MKTLIIFLFAWTMAFAGNPNDMKSYIEKSGKEPMQYITDKFKEKDIVIFSEIHKLKHELDFVKSLLPVVYNAGINSIAVEFGNVQDQAKMDKLITNESFDKELAMQIMRNYKGKEFFGYQEYMNIYKAAWEINQSDNKSKFRVILIGNSKTPVKMNGKTLILSDKNNTSSDYANSFTIKFHTAKQKEMSEVYDQMTNRNPVAFDLAGSPMKISSDGYIYLKSPKEFEPLTWIDDFITEEYLPVVKGQFRHLPVETIDYATELCKACDWNNYETLRGMSTMY